LGIEISENLSWKNHIQYLCPKLNKDWYFIKSLRNSVSLQVFKNIYFTKFESILKYGIIFWGGGCKEVEAVFKIKKKMSKSDHGSKQSSPVNTGIKLYNNLPFELKKCFRF
jgi:hypothetical protein